ncbi:uncharacterized protein [Clytia hemisphaerica]|uniref:Uncharacterized protein n=1 Tax=Clytia hemisphaerica TaxID=252671 RepID=A0A7M5V7E2_9CNID|eukprot:TCONS_00009354-protein
MGPKKKNEKGSKKKKDEKSKEQIEITNKLKLLLKDYEKQCSLLKSTADPALKATLKDFTTEGKYLTRFILRGAPIVDDTTKNLLITDINQTQNDEEKYLVKIHPLIKSLRNHWYKTAKEFYFWDLDIPREDISELVTYLSHRSYNVEYIEFLDCKIEWFTLKAFSSCFAVNETLTSVVLDYTNLKFDGLVGLCDGLQSTKSVTKLSLCYCQLSPKCGAVLGDLVSKSTISELYVDGNQLECVGLIDILQIFVDKAEQEAIKRKEEKQAKIESVVGMYSENEKKSAISTKTTEPNSTKNASSAKKKGKKKGRKKKKSAKPKLPPKCGAWLNVLHASDVGFDGMSTDVNGNLLHQSLILIQRWIIFSEDLKEIDLDDNLIGELGGLEILSALRQRKEEGLKPIYMKVTHRMDTQVFKNILSLASGKSKRGGKKKKKKKGNGKKRV